jgi:serine/threonine-protein kinase RsbT
MNTRRPTSAKEIRVAINAESDIIAARQAGRDTAKQLGFGLADQTRLATAISELARNIIKYAEKGECIVSDISDAKMVRVKVEVIDDGPGIGDVKKAMTDGFSTGRSLGMGLPGTKRLVHDFAIDSSSSGTKIAVGLSRPR